jgi:hypothetical protein
MEACPRRESNPRSHGYESRAWNPPAGAFMQKAAWLASGGLLLSAPRSLQFVASSLRSPLRLSFRARFECGPITARRCLPAYEAADRAGAGDPLAGQSRRFEFDAGTVRAEDSFENPAQNAGESGALALADGWDAEDRLREILALTRFNLL